jgi:hypothetical protein
MTRRELRAFVLEAVDKVHQRALSTCGFFGDMYPKSENTGDSDKITAGDR